MFKGKISVVIILCLLLIPAWLVLNREDSSISKTTVDQYINKIKKTTISTPKAFRNNVDFWKNIYTKTSMFSVVYYTPVEYKVLKTIDARLDVGLRQGSLLEISLQDDGQEIARYALDGIDSLSSINILLVDQVREKIDEIYDNINQKLHDKKIIPENKNIGYTRGRKEKYQNAWKFSGKYIDEIKQIFISEKIPEEIAYLAFTESSFDVYAKSNSNAVGLFQMIPETAKRYGLMVHKNIDQRNDPILETKAAALYLKELYSEFGNWLWAINAYHSGESNLRQAKKWANKYYPVKPQEFDGTLEDYQYSKVVFEFPDDKEFNINTLKYGTQSARYTTLFLAFLESRESFSRTVSKDSPIDYKTINVNYSKDYIKEEKVYVENGDNLFNLAYYYGVSVDNIKKWNNLETNLIRTGDVLIVNIENPPITFQSIVNDLSISKSDQADLLEYNYSYKNRDSSIEDFLQKSIYNKSTINTPKHLKKDIENYLSNY